MAQIHKSQMTVARTLLNGIFHEFNIREINTSMCLYYDNDNITVINLNLKLNQEETLWRSLKGLFFWWNHDTNCFLISE